MAEFFVSYTSCDRPWAEWIGQRLVELGHVPHLHDWEIEKGGDIAAWMEAAHDASDFILCVVSAAYLKAHIRAGSAVRRSGWRRPGAPISCCRS